MSFINYSSKEIHCKIVYYGPGLSGKTSNLKYIYDKSNPSTRGRFISFSDEEENRTLFFDFLPLDLGDIKGFRTRFHLYTIPGQVIHESSRRLILKGSDGIVFVADSQKERMDANLKSYESLKINLDEYGYQINKIPMVFQYNKRDLKGALSISEIAASINQFLKPEFEAVAITGQGVFDTLKKITKQVLDELKGGNIT